MATKTPQTQTMTSHGLLITVGGSGVVVGTVTGWAPRHTRTVTPVYELGAGLGTTTVGGGDDIQADPGEPYELVPGNIGGTSISIRRYDIHTKRFEQAFGTNNLEMLGRQDKSIRFVEYWKNPDESLAFRYMYYGVWFTSLGRDFSAEGNRIIMVSAEAQYTRRREA